MKTATVNTICSVRAFEGYPLTRCTLKGKTWCDYYNKWLFVVKPLESRCGYIKGNLDTCQGIIPVACHRWLQKGLRFVPKPFNIDMDSLPVIAFDNSNLY